MEPLEFPITVAQCERALRLLGLNTASVAPESAMCQVTCRPEDGSYTVAINFEADELRAEKVPQ